jgi:hypothetical protein
VVLAWAAMADLLVFSAFVSSSQSLLALADAADGFVVEFAVDQWTMARTSYLLHYFLFPLVLP